MAGVAEQFHQRGKAGIGIEADHVAAWHRDVAGGRLTQVQHVAQHGAFHRAEIGAGIAWLGGVAFGLGFVDRLFQAFAERGFGVAAEQIPQRPQPAAAAQSSRILTSLAFAAATVALGHGRSSSFVRVGQVEGHAGGAFQRFHVVGLHLTNLVIIG